MNLRRITGPDPWSISLEGNRGRYDDGPGISASTIGITALVGLVANSTRGPQAGKPTSLTG